MSGESENFMDDQPSKMTSSQPTCTILLRDLVWVCDPRPKTTIPGYQQRSRGPAGVKAALRAPAFAVVEP